MKIALALNSNDKYCAHLATCLVSFLEHNATVFSDVNIYILEDDITDRNKQRLNNMVERYAQKTDINIAFINVSDVLKKLKIQNLNEWNFNRYPASTYLSKFVDKFVDNDEEVVLSIDTDIVFLNRVDGLLKHDISDKAVWGVNDFGVAGVSLKEKDRIGMKPDQIYMNAGVNLFNLKRWRAGNLTEHIVDDIRNIPDPSIIRGDQCILNLFTPESEKGVLPLRYNTPCYLFDSGNGVIKSFSKQEDILYTKEEILTELDNAVILHFLGGGAKPWNKGYRVAKEEEYFKYKVLTPWKDEPLVDLGRTESKLKRILKKGYYKIVPSKVHSYVAKKYIC